MTDRTFSLLPFPAPGLPDMLISGTIARHRNRLAIHYSISGETEKIVIPEAIPLPSRRSELWTSTCFEFFLATPGRTEYWEVNLSPSGGWNVYHMQAYRRVGFREEARVTDLQLAFQHTTGYCLMEAALDLSAFIADGDPIQAGVSSVLKTFQGRETYWALVHPGPQADFHRRESFILSL